MKLLSLGLALLVIAPAQAQVFRPRMDRGGAGSGHHRTSVSVGVHYSPAPYRTHWRGGYWDRGFYGGYYAPVVSYYPSYGYYDGYGAGYPYYGSYGTSTSGAANGLLLGALAGGIIGNSSGSLHHSGWRGAAWGAGVGWLLGSIADASRRPVTYATPVAAPTSVAGTTAAAAPATSSPQQVTIINNYYQQPATPMTAANGLFGR